jgi:hypothetical protein
MGTMSASGAAPLPRLGEVFFDVRGSSRSMRLSWYADTGVSVFSIWQGGTCTGTFRLPMEELPRLIDALQRGMRSADPRGPGHYASQLPGAPTDPRLTALPGGHGGRGAEFTGPVTGDFGALRPDEQTGTAVLGSPVAPAAEGYADRGYGGQQDAYPSRDYDQPGYGYAGTGHPDALGGPGYAGAGEQGYQGYDMPGYDGAGQGYDGQGYQGQGYDVGAYGERGYDARGRHGQRNPGQDYQDPGYQAGAYQDSGYQDSGYQDSGYQDSGYRGTGYQEEGGRSGQGYGEYGYPGDGGGYDGAGAGPGYPAPEYQGHAAQGYREEASGYPDQGYSQYSYPGQDYQDQGDAGSYPGQGQGYASFGYEAHEQGYQGGYDPYPGDDDQESTASQPAVSSFPYEADPPAKREHRRRRGR